MEIKEFQMLLKAENELMELATDINRDIVKINETHYTIKKKYQQETKSVFGDENIVNKNLIVYLLIKHGIKLNKPTQISNSKFVININSKKLIMFNKSMHFDFQQFLTTLKGLTDEKIKDAVAEFESHAKQIFQSSNYYSKVNHQRFNEKSEGEGGKITLDYNSDYSSRLTLTYHILNVAGDNCARAIVYNTSDETFSTEFSFNSQFFKFKDEDIINSVALLKKNLLAKIVNYSSELKSYTTLLNEFQLV